LLSRHTTWNRDCNSGSLAAFVASFSWLGRSIVAGLLWYHGKRSREIERMTALRGEIKANLIYQEKLSDHSRTDALIARVEFTPDFKFFVPIYRDDVVFDVVKIDITTLPPDPINEVVDYYNKSNGLDVIMARLEEPRFDGLEISRKVNVLRAVRDTAEDVFLAGRLAIAKLDDQIARSNFQKWLLTGLATATAVLGGVELYRLTASLWAF
jgi:hypothetical protein